MDSNSENKPASGSNYDPLDPQSYKDMWEEKEEPKIREVDFSDVRKHIFSPWRIIVFLIFSIAFWILYFFILNN